MPILEDCQFWAVWTKTGHLPRFLHHTKELAIAEAKRLATKNPGKKFIVLRVSAKFHVPSALAPDVPVVAVEADA